MPITNLTLTYPDFVLNTKIDPEQFDTNNAEIVNKINEVLNILHSIDGARELIVDTIADVSNSTDLQTFLNNFKTYIDAEDDGISQDLLAKYNEIIALLNTKNTEIANLQSTKANKTDVYTKLETYTKTEVDTAVTGAKTYTDTKDSARKTYVDTSIANLNSSINTELTNKQTQIDTINTNKANKSEVYTKLETYTKTEVDNKLSTNKTDIEGKLNTHKTSTDHDGRYYTKTEADGLMNNKVTVGGNHTGTWQGYSPVEVEPAVSSMLQELLSKVDIVSEAMPLRLTAKIPVASKVTVARNSLVINPLDMYNYNGATTVAVNEFAYSNKQDVQYAFSSDLQIADGKLVKYKNSNDFVYEII